MEDDSEAPSNLEGCTLALNSLQAMPQDEYPFRSLANQLRYLIDLESGANQDRGKLKDIIIGVLTSKYLEGMGDLERMLHEVSARVRRMNAHPQ